MKNMVAIVVPRIAAEWNTVAYYMDFEITEIKIIKEKCREDPEKCCIELLERWLQIKPDRNWEMLLTVLKQVRNLTTVTEKIENDLKNLQLYVNIIFKAYKNYLCPCRSINPSDIVLASATKEGTLDYALYRLIMYRQYS